MAFYKIEDEVLLKPIRDAYKGYLEYRDKCDLFAASFGFEHVGYFPSSMTFGCRFAGIVVTNQELEGLDSNKWKVDKRIDSEYSKISPRRTNKSFAKEYDEKRARLGNFSYNKILELITNPSEWGRIIQLGVNDYCVLLKTNHVLDNKKEGLIEIVESEFNDLIAKPQI